MHIKIKILKNTILLLIFPIILYAQGNITELGKKSGVMDELMRNMMEKEFKKKESNASSMFSKSEITASINVEEYIVDAGDEFLIKIFVKGPNYKIYTNIVTPAGFIVIPDGPSIEVRYKKLEEAQKQIERALKQWFPNTRVGVYLKSLHSIEANVLGAIPKPGKVKINSNYRLFDAIFENLNKTNDEKEYKKYIEKISSFRNIQLIRRQQSKTYDLFKYRYLGDLSQNPYIMDQDLIYIPYRDSSYATFSVRGAVSHESTFEYQKGDCLSDVIKYCGGLLQSADSNNIELQRFKKDTSIPQKIILSLPADNNFILMQGDRIIARSKHKFHDKYEVMVRGEVRRPGIYIIEDGITTLTSVINEAGGFTDRASLENAKIIRNIQVGPRQELQRLKGLRIEEMNDLEKNYLRLRSRENSQIVTCNFDRLFIENALEENVILRNNDEIIIPMITNIVYVSGGVISPGNVNYKKELNYRDYVDLAGGFNSRALEGDIYIIKAITGVWMEADEDVLIREGDIVFIPEKEYFDWYDFFKESLFITTQIATVVLIVVNLQNLAK